MKSIIKDSIIANCSVLIFALLQYAFFQGMVFGQSENPSLIPQTIIDPYPLKANKINKLLAVGATYSNNLGQFGPQSTYMAKQFWLTDWRDPKDIIKWNVSTSEAGEFRVIFMIDCQKGQRIQVTGPGNSFIFSAPEDGWQRVTSEDVLSIPKGTGMIQLSLVNPSARGIRIKSIELINQAEEKNIIKRAQAFKGDVSWMKESGYGIMVQGGEWTYPPTGDKMKWPGMTENFDAEAFVQWVHEMGGKFLLWSATWTTYYFPAPIKSIEEILPDRISRRDLIGDLIKACKKRNIRFIMYYHLGHDEEIVLKAKGWESDWYKKGRNLTDWLNLEMKIFTEIGNRYGKDLDAIFLDDACTWYPADFEKLGAALKAGNPNRVICYNPWIAPLHTPFQDFYCGEGFDGTNTPWPIKDGVFTAGPQKGLQAWGNYIFDGPGWGIKKPNTKISAPKKWSKEKLINLTRRLEEQRFSVALNLLIYEDGTFGKESYEMMRAVAKELKRGNWEE